jgi:hypothetical protein
MNPRHPRRPAGVAAAFHQLLVSLSPGWDGSYQRSVEGLASEAGIINLLSVRDALSMLKLVLSRTRKEDRPGIGHLEELLAAEARERPKLIVFEALYSMDGGRRAGDPHLRPRGALSCHDLH